MFSPAVNETPSTAYAHIHHVLLHLALTNSQAPFEAVDDDSGLFQMKVQ